MATDARSVWAYCKKCIELLHDSKYIWGKGSVFELEFIRTFGNLAQFHFVIVIPVANGDNGTCSFNVV